MNNSMPASNGRVKFITIPAYLKRRRQWVLWKYERNKNGKLTKPPYQPSGAKAKSNDSSTWSTYEEVKVAYKRGGFDGIGFCFARDDGLAGIDLDHCFNSKGELEQWAQEIVNRFAETYIERSPGGDGLHIWCFGRKTGSQTSKKWLKPGYPGVKQGIEVYDSTRNRFFTVTGDAING